MTVDTNAPERICIWNSSQNEDGSVDHRGWTTSFPEGHPRAYIRLDLHDAAVRKAREVKVRTLAWEDQPKVEGPVVSMAVCQIGTYFICDDTDDFTGLFCELVAHKNATWFGSVDCSTVEICSHQHTDDHSPLQAAAQADYERRIREALE